MTTLPDDELARFRALVRQIESLVAGPAPLAATNPDGTPGRVAAGELIESAWGNSVSDTVGTHHHSLPWMAYGSLSGGWGSGLRAIGGLNLPSIVAGWWPFKIVVIANYRCVGAAGSGAPLNGGTVRTRFTIDGVDNGISANETAQTDEILVHHTFQHNRAAGSAVGALTIQAETSKPCNIGGSFYAYGIVNNTTHIP